MKFNFYRQEHHFKTGMALALLFALCYTLPNQLEWLPATNVPLHFFDNMVPFQPGWIWIYLLTYAYVVLIYFFVLEEENAKTFVNSFVLSSVIGAVIFFFLPTIISRDLYPLNPDQDIHSWTLYYFRFIDKPKNCIPSFHIALTFLTSASLYNTDTKKKVFGIIMGILIAYSTMAVKQHYFWDVFSGFIVGVASFFAALKLASK